MTGFATSKVAYDMNRHCMQTEDQEVAKWRCLVFVQ